MRPVRLVFAWSLVFKIGDGPKTGLQLRSWSVLVRSGLGLFPVLRLDLRTLLPTDNDMIVRTFRKGLNRVLATRILYSDKKPDTLNDTTTKKGWYTIAIEFNRIHWDNVQALNDRPDKPTGQQLNPPNNRFRQAYGRGYAAGPAYNRGNYQQPRYDPNAMDIDIVTTAINAMSYKEWGEFLKKGLCFKCRQPGHVAWNCPNANNRPRNPYNNNRNDNRNSFTLRSNNPFKRNDTNAPKKPGPHEINKYICALNAEERDTLWDIAEEDDDKKGPNEKDFIWGELGRWQSLRLWIFLKLTL